MMSKWRWLVLQASRRLWVRAVLIALLSIASALAATVVSPVLPPGLSERLGAGSVGSILEILASSMLVVATFSLATLISSYSAASASTTPRVTELLIRDAEAQNAIATFVGGFLFSLVGLVGLSAGLYGQDGQVILFAVTVGVIGIIVGTFLRWIDLLSRLGRVGDAVRRATDAAQSAVEARHASPFLGGRAWPQRDSPAFAVTTGRVGYVQHIDMEVLEALAAEAGGEVYVESLPGSLADPSRPLVRLSFRPDEAAAQTARAAFTLGDERSFDQDPRFGVIVLAEIATKALSPGVNDPGTAIQVLGMLVRVLAAWVRPRVEPVEVRFERVYVPAMTPSELLEDAFGGVAHHAADSPDVGLRLQKALRALYRLGDAECRGAARRVSEEALERARCALRVPGDVARLEAIAASFDRGLAEVAGSSRR